MSTLKLERADKSKTLRKIVGAANPAWEEFTNRKEARLVKWFFLSLKDYVQAK